MESGRFFFNTDQLQDLLNILQDNGYDCIGPQARDGAIIYDGIHSVEQLPRGISDKQQPGSYRLDMNSGSKYFDWANGPQAIKPLLFTPKETLWSSTRSADGDISFCVDEQETRKLAVIGARACDIAAMKIHDLHFLKQEYIDPYYKARRDKLLIIAVNCGHPAETCFCHSTGDGPFAEDGFDIALTELQDGFIVSAQTRQGEMILAGLSLQDCTKNMLAESERIKARASKQKRQLPGHDIKSRMMHELDNEAWHDIATKCLSCGNCTSVCPTCFCHAEKEAPELDGKSSVHYREWDSCFGQDHSRIHGITIRSQTSQRYRQWLTHKFSTWHEQYGRSGCVGCGRCIAWCPVGIDVTESVARIVENGNK
jgi:ferredoxin